MFSLNQDTLQKTIMIILLFFLLYVSGMVQNCNDVEKYKPPSDSLADPPDEIPLLIFPPNDTDIVFGQNGHGWDTVWVHFQWTEVNEAEYYQLEVADNMAFNNSQVHKVGSNSIIVPMGPIGETYWHVRAGSDYWTWYTDWSATGFFKLIYPPY